MMKIVKDSHEDDRKEIRIVILKAVMIIIRPKGNGVEGKISLMLRDKRNRGMVLCIIGLSLGDQLASWKEAVF